MFDLYTVCPHCVQHTYVMVCYFVRRQEPVEIKAVRGMHDLFGEELAAWKKVETQIFSILESFGYSEIRTPVLENLEVFKGTVGDDTDIVEKQMYTIEKEKETLVLRPEGTAAFMRAVLEHQLHQSGNPGRFFYYLPMFRHERPQKGRLRQFHQVGIEIINDPSPEADAEIIAVLDQVYKNFNISEYEIRINSVGCSDCRPAYKESLKKYFQPRLAELCELCQKRFERSPLRILDCKKESCKEIAKGAPLISESLCAVCKTHHTKLKLRLDQISLKYIDDPSIVRGLDYYCRTAFEFTSDLLGAQSALGGGGRYDGLSARFGKANFASVGLALGMERLIIALETKGLLPKDDARPVFFFAALGEKAFQILYPLSMELKRRGIRTEMLYEENRGLKNLLKHANRFNAEYTLILGDTEVDQKAALLKDMKAGTQENISLDGLLEELIRRKR